MENFERFLRARNVLSLDKQAWERFERSSGPVRDRIVAIRSFAAPNRDFEIAEFVAAGAGSNDQLTDEYQISLLVDCVPDSPMLCDYGDFKFVRPSRPGEMLLQDLMRQDHLEGTGPYHSIIFFTSKQRVHNYFLQLGGHGTPDFTPLYRSSFRDEDLECLIKGLANSCWAGGLSESDLDNRLRVICRRLFEISGNLNDIFRHEENCSPAMAKMLNHLRENLSSDSTVDDLAKIAGMSAGHFRREFRSQFGMSPKKVLINIRLEKLKRLLRESPLDKPLAQLAEECGYGTQSHLHHEFRQSMLISPDQYRRQQ